MDLCVPCTTLVWGMWLGDIDSTVLRTFRRSRIPFHPLQAQRRLIPSEPKLVLLPYAGSFLTTLGPGITTWASSSHGTWYSVLCTLDGASLCFTINLKQSRGPNAEKDRQQTLLVLPIWPFSLLNCAAWALF